MKKNIAYRYIRIVCRKLLIMFTALFLVVLIIPLTPLTLDSGYYPLLIISLLGIFYSILMLVKPELHHVFWRLKKYGPAQSVAEQIDADTGEYCEEVILSTVGYRATFTPSWIVWTRGFLGMQVRIVNFADITQIYQKTVSANGFEQYSLVIRTDNGRKTTMHFYRNEELIPVIMNRIQQTTPSVQVGYDGWF